MAKLKVGKGVDEYLKKLDTLVQLSESMIMQAVYPGAGLVADAVKAEIKSLPVQNQYVEGMKNGITQWQKAGLIEGLGIATHRNDNGYVNVKIGEDGYNSVIGKKYPKGQPNALIARAVESGTSFRKPNPFISRAVNRTKAKAEQTMSDKLDELYRKEFN